MSPSRPRRALDETLPPADEAAPAADAAAPRSDVDAAADRAPEGERRAGRSAAIMASGTLLSRVLGFVRAALLTVALGATGTFVDVFEMANSLPNIIYILLVGGVFNVVLVPQLIKHAKDADRGADYTSRLMTLAVLVMAAATVLVTAAAAPMMAALTRDWEPAKLQLGTVFALWCLPQIFFYGMYALVGQVLNANGRFGAYMWAPVLNNVVAIGALGLYLAMFGAYAGGTNRVEEWTTAQTVVLAGGHTLGVVLQAVILYLPLRSLGLRLRPTFGWRGMGLRHTGRIAGYTLVTMVVSNVILLLMQRYLSTATEARDAGLRVPGTEGWSEEMAAAAIPGVTAFNLALLITILPHSVFVLSLATVYFNRLARAMDAEDLDAVRTTTTQGLRLFTVPLMLALAALVVLAGPIGRLFGSFSDTSLASGMAVGAMILIMAAAIPFRSSGFYLMRVFYAAEDAKVPMVVQIATAVLGLAVVAAGAVVLPPTLLGPLVALGSTLSYVGQFLLMHVLTVRRFGDYGVASVLRAHLQTGVAAVVAAAAGAVVVLALGGYTDGFAWRSIGSAVVTCLAAGLVMVPVYAVVLRLLRFPELDAAIAPLARRVPGLGRALKIG